MAEAMDVQAPENLGEGVGAARIPAIPPATARPTCVVCLGMAGSGKTTFVQVTYHGAPPAFMFIPKSVWK